MGVFCIVFALVIEHPSPRSKTMTTLEDLAGDIVALDPDLAGLLIAASFESKESIRERIAAWKKTHGKTRNKD